ncbi:MAG: hypothetical protein ACRDT2_06440 [Natronosporangium sp.]
MDTACTLLSPTDLDVVYLLVLGAQRPTIARDLRLTTRAVDQRVAGIKRIIGAPDRFGLGVAAIRRRLVNPTYPVAHASARRADAEWVLPTKRQYEFLRLRSTGSTVDQVTEKTGMSASSVRQQLARLATRNGASNAVSAGALFEALGWT